MYLEMAIWCTYLEVKTTKYSVANRKYVADVLNTNTEILPRKHTCLLMHVIGRPHFLIVVPIGWQHRRHEVNWPILSKTVLSEFPFNHDVRFEFLATSSSEHCEWNSIFQNFKNRTISRGIPNFSKVFFFLSEVFVPFNFAPWISRIFEVECFAFRKLNIFRNFWELFRKLLLYHLPLFPNFRKFWLVNGKRPTFSLLFCILVVFVPSTNVQSHGQTAVFYLCFYQKSTSSIAAD